MVKNLKKFDFGYPKIPKPKVMFVKVVTSALLINADILYKK